MASDKEFDPRFDPAFQRGFESVGLGGSSGPANVPPHDPAPSSFALGNLEPGADGDPSRLGDPLNAAAGVEATTPAFDEPARASAPSLVGNPWVRALWILSTTFLLTGLLSEVWIALLSTSNTNAFEALVLPALLQGLAPWLMLTGLAAGVGVVFLHAVRWRPHP